ncbi:MAG: glycosyltransferase [Microthrixaceae bacterium]
MTEAPKATVVIAIRTLRIGGAETLAVHEATELAALGYPVEVWYQIDGPFRRELDQAGIEVRKVPLLGGRRRLRSLARQADGRLIVHTHSPSSGGFLRLMSLGIDNLAFIHTEHNGSAAYRPVTRMVHRATGRRIDHLVAVSSAALKTAPAARRRSVLQHLDLSLPRMRECLALPPKHGGPLRMICVASLTAKKDHATLLSALIILDRSIDEPLEVALVGDGPLRSTIASQAEVLNQGCHHVKVELTGHLDDVAQALKGADVLVLSSVNEGLPLVLVEAMAASTPIVATDVGGVREWCDDGRVALLVPPSDPAAMAVALESLLSDGDLRTQLADRAKTHLLTQVDGPWFDTYREAIDRLSCGL